MTEGTSGTWQARCRRPDGALAQTTLGTLEEHRAHERFDKAVAAARAWFDTNLHPTVKQTGATTVRDACGDYINHVRELKGDGPALELEARYRRWVWGDPIHKLELSKLTREHLTGFRRRMLNTPVKVRKSGETRVRSKDTVNRDVATLRAALNYAFVHGKTPSDAAWREPLKAFKGVSKRRSLYLDRNQRRALIQAAPTDLARFLTGLSMLPLRPGALAALHVRDFDARLRVLTVGSDKSGRDRMIKLPPQCAAILHSAAEGKAGSDPLFTREDGVAWNKDSWYVPIKAAVKAAGLPSSATAYTLRHSVISDLVHGGLDLLTVAQISGTSVAMIEKHYGHLRESIAESALAGLAL
jgi:site-specific recombinase XerD